jgi:predicted anti-sigma-YlaC factor YlaD
MSAITSCREASRLASRAIDGPLPLGSRIALRMHLAMCRACRAYRRQLGLIDRLVRGRAAAPPADEDLQLSDEARKRISEALRRR